MGSSTIFTGNSTYSQDFSQVIERTMAIAELPLVQLEQQRLRTQDEAAAMGSLLGTFESLRLAVKEISNQASKTVFDATISQSGVVSATVGESAKRGSFQVEVSDLGSYTSFLGATGVVDPTTEGLGAELTKTLIVDGQETSLTLATNSLEALADAINESESGLTASIINVSSSGTPNYKLVVQGNKLGAQSISLKDGDALGADLLEGSALQTGSALQYKLNGVAVSADSRNVVIAPGLDLQITGTTSGSGVTVTVGRSASRVTDALQSFVAAFNQASAAVDQHRGQGAGVLKGQSTIQTLSHMLRQITSYSNSGGRFATLTDAGLRFDDQGRLSLETDALAGLGDGDLTELLGFLGSTDGDGFTAAANGSLQSATDAEFGFLKGERTSLEKQSKGTQEKIDQMRERLDTMETDLRERFAVMDSVIASMQQQAIYINGMFEAMRVAQKSYSG